MPVTMAFLLFFLLTSGDLLYLKIVQSFDTLKEKRAAYQALRSRLDVAHTLDSLAASACMSRRSLTRHFRALTGTTFNAWLLT